MESNLKKIWVNNVDNMKKELEAIQYITKEFQYLITDREHYIFDVYPKIETLEQYFLKIYQLEEKLGCSFDVIFRALEDGIYVEDGTFEKYDVRGIELKGLEVISNICSYGDCDFTCYYKDYKKTWWLKKDKSE